MSVQADWGVQTLPDAAEAEVDPFESPSLTAMGFPASTAPATPSTLGPATAADWMFPVSMDTPPEELRRLLGLTQRTQNRLFNEGMDCELRWRQGSTCLACPLSEADNPASPKCHLCRTSCQEERLETVALAQRFGDGG